MSVLGQCSSEASALSAQWRASPAVFSASLLSVHRALCGVWIRTVQIVLSIELSHIGKVGLLSACL